MRKIRRTSRSNMELLLPQGWPRALSASTDGETCEKGIYICDSKHLTCQACNKFVDRIAEEVAMGGTVEKAVEDMKVRQIAFLKRDAAAAGSLPGQLGKHVGFTWWVRAT